MFNYSNMLLLYLAGMVYFILICNLLYPIVELVMGKIGFETAAQNEITLSKISYQWTGVVYMIMLFMIMILRNLNLLLKLV